MSAYRYTGPVQQNQTPFFARAMSGMLGEQAQQSAERVKPSSVTGMGWYFTRDNMNALRTCGVCNDGYAEGYGYNNMQRCKGEKIESPKCE